MKMTDEHKRFIREDLVPFMLRENGNGFAMESWMYFWPLDVRTMIYFDDVGHEKPACHTVCCIGGSIEYLVRQRYEKNKNETQLRHALDAIGAVIGLDPIQASALFHGWIGNANRQQVLVWPKRYQREFEDATTPAGKARVAADLLLEIADTEGAVLDEGDRWKSSSDGD